MSARDILQAAAGVGGAVACDWVNPDIANTTYDGISTSITPASTSSPGSCRFGNGGSLLYVVSSSNNSIGEFDLSTPYDLSSAVYRTKNVVPDTVSPWGLYISDDGVNAYITSWITNLDIRAYTMSTPWDTSTLSYVVGSSFPLSGQDSMPAGVVFSPDGLYFYVAGQVSDFVYQYALGTAWDLTTAYYTNKKVDILTESYLRDLFLSPQGDKLYVVGRGADTVYEYSVATAFDMSTASYSGVSYYIGGVSGFATGMTFSPCGDKMYIVDGSSMNVFQFSV